MRHRRVYLHGLGWLAYGCYLWLGAVLGGKSMRQSLWLTASFVGVGALVFYVCYHLIFGRVGQLGRRGVGVWAALSGMVALFVGLRYAIEEILYPAVLGFGNYNSITPGEYLLDNLYYVAPPVLLSALVWSFETARRRERENQQLRQEKADAEEAFLRTQLNPHFLYNTLNFLYALAYPVPGPLPGALLQVADLMRYQLRRSPDGLVSLTEEVEYINQYVGLYRLRFAGKCCVDITLTGEPLADRRLPPLLLLPFVENALKHGVLHRPDTPVRIHLHLTATALTFDVYNVIGSHHKDPTGGVGLPNVRRRLALLYPASRHQLLLGPTPAGTFQARLHLLLA